MAEIRWYGHNCFRIKAKEATVLTDPVDRSTGYAMAKQTADIVTLSHEHTGHTRLDAVKPEFKIIHGPGEYEMNDVFVTGIRTYHDDAKGAERGYNTVYVIEMEGLTFAHLGDLGHRLTETQSEALNNVDVLFVPAGGGTVVSPEHAAELATELSPKAIIPMQYATPVGDRDLGTVDQFCKHLGVDMPEAQDKLTLRPSDLSDTMQIFILNPDSEPARR